MTREQLPVPVEGDERAVGDERSQDRAPRLVDVDDGALQFYLEALRGQ